MLPFLEQTVWRERQLVEFRSLGGQSVLGSGCLWSVSPNSFPTVPS